MKKTEFLTLAEITEIHSDQIRRYGGKGGTRDINLLSSATAMPYASFSGDFLHKDIYEMAAAYAFHICRNHPFIDGNKMTALAALRTAHATTVGSPVPTVLTGGGQWSKLVR
jgi:death-on-curing protein